MYIPIDETTYRFTLHVNTNQTADTQFVVAELGTEGSIDGNNRLVLRGKYVPKGIEVR